MALYPRAWLAAALLCAALPIHAVDVSGPRVETGPSAGRGGPVGTSGQQGQTPLATQMRLDLGGSIRPVGGAPTLAPAGAAAQAQAVPTALPTETTLKMPLPAALAASPSLSPAAAPKAWPMNTPKAAPPAATASDPVGEAPTGIYSVDEVKKALGAAGEAEKKGQVGATEKALDAVFEGRAKGSESAGVAAQAAASKGSGLKKAGKASGLARQVQNSVAWLAPQLYEQALSAAKDEARTGADYQRFASELDAALSPKAESRLKFTLRVALEAAEKGSLDKESAESLMTSAVFWSGKMFGVKTEGLREVARGLDALNAAAKAGRQSGHAVSFEKEAGVLKLTLRAEGAKELAAKAKGAPALEAPALYDRALAAAKQEAKSEGEYKKFVAELNASMAAHAEASLQKAVIAAMGLAQSEQLARQKRNEVMGAIGFWAELLPYKVEGLEALDNTLALIDAQVAAGLKPSYELVFEKGPGGATLALHPALTAAGILSKWKAKPPAPSLSRFQPKAAPLTFRNLQPAPKTGLVAGATAKMKAAAATVAAWLGAKERETAAATQEPAPYIPRDWDQAPDTVKDEPAARPAEAQPAFVSLTLEAPRRARNALGYELLFAPGGAQGVPVAQEAPVLELERSGTPESVARLRRRFDVFNGLIETNFAALELMAQSSGKMTVKTAKALAAKVRAMAEAYKELARGSDAALEYLSRLKKVEALLSSSYGTRGDSELASEFTTALVMTLDRESLHKLINELHQAALDAVGQSEDESGKWETNLTARLKQGERVHEVPLVDLSEHPLVRGRHVVSPVLRALLEGLRRAHDTPKGSLIAQDHQFWGHFQLGAHKAEVYANFLPPDEGGMVRVRYQEWGDGLANQSRLYYVARILERLGFAVQQDNGFLTAVIDKDHAAQSVDQMMDRFSVSLQALHSTVGVDFALPIMLQGSKSSEESGRRIDEWVDVVLGEGDLPFYVNDDHDAMVKGFRERQAQDAQNLALKASLSAFLVRLGLPAIPGDQPFGQRTLDRFYNRPLEAAVARGEVKVLMDGTMSRSGSYDPVGTLAQDASRDPKAGGRLAEAVGSLDPQLFTFQTVGSLGALTAQRAQRRLDDGRWLTLYALRDPQTGQVGLARAEVGAAGVGVSPKAIDAAALFELLSREGHPVAAFTPSQSPAGLGATVRRLRETPADDGGLGTTFRGLAASPGKGRAVVGRLTYDKARAEKGGALFVAAYTTPDDLEAIRKSKAVITTSGGLLSHAAITTREMSIPAVILSHAEWEGGAAVLESPTFGKPRPVSGALARDVTARKSVPLKEGAVARLDPVTGVIEVFPDAMGGAMLELAAALERFDSGGEAASLAAWAKDRLNASRGNLERMALGRELVREVAQRAAARADAVTLLQRVLAALPRATELERVMTAEAEQSAFSEQLRVAYADLREQGEVAREAASVESLERALLKASGRMDRLQSLALAFGRPASDLSPMDAAYKGIVSLGRERMSALVAEDINELQQHARAFPSMTVDALPRIRALIAKAKRRKLSPQLYESWEKQAAKLEAQRVASQRAKAPSVLPLSSILDVDVPWVGGKASKLGEVMQVVLAAGGEVPAGFALTIHAYRRFLKEAGLEARIDKIGADSKLSLEARSAQIRELILRAPLSADKGVGAEILKALKDQKMEGTALAVRSSAVDEDGADAAFAGAGDTHLYVQGDELLSHVREVWSSLWNPRALQYRQAKGLSLANLNQAVVVQAMAPSEVAGVAFTQDPVSGNSGRLIVNAAFGLGEGVVSGRVAPDQYVVGKSDGRELLPAMIADKKLAIVAAESGRGTKEKRVEASRRRARALSPSQLRTLNTVAHALERHFGYALDIEFGFVGDKLYILQSRPVTHAAEGAGEQKSGREEAKPPKKVVFVCAGNTCRSAMAEAMAKATLARHGRSDLAVASRGLAVAVEGQPMSSGARAALKARGVEAVSHSAATLTAADVAASDLILAMTAQQAYDILRRHPQAEGKVYTLSGYAGAGGDIEDPYGSGREAFEASARAIEAAVDAALDALATD